MGAYSPKSAHPDVAQGKWVFYADRDPVKVCKTCVP